MAQDIILILSKFTCFLSFSSYIGSAWQQPGTASQMRLDQWNMSKSKSQESSGIAETFSVAVILLYGRKLIVSWDCAKSWSCIPVLDLLCAAATCQVCRQEWELLILRLAWHPGLSHASLCCLPAETGLIPLDHDLSYSTRCACSTSCTLCALVWIDGTHHARQWNDSRRM